MQSNLRKWSGAAIVSLAATASPALATSCMNPSLVPSIDVSKHEVCWSPVPGASGYDVAGGLSLARLGVAAPTLVEAGLACLGSAQPSNCISVPYDPPAGDGFFFVVRANRGNSTGTYESGCPAEVPGRDAALIVAALCP